ncbi:hypothetical protein [Nostoc sp. TCL26-01]|uniref:hypothetical protein n=1 Tax=Nostoc sp. TCL26-01 TaxID=2576904 RepID=UPI0015BE8171|nr:hypothetical protein [Nostoc sp. TCL26-01]QLE57225.1 hypothetical protein FD725_17880 [Nostoc sp. TCL26-01]
MTTDIQFNAKVNNGTIEIPVEYQDEIHNAEIVKIVILKPSSKKKRFPPTGIIAQLTANPIQIADFKQLTREEANERW